MMTGVVLLILRITLALVLYSFLAWGIYALWQDLRRTQATARHSPDLILTWDHQGQPFQHKARGQALIVGRDPTCDCCISDPTLSSRHARLSYHHGQWWVEDMGSKNGTFLNESPVDQPVVITHADKLRCGGIQFLLAIEP